MTWVTKMTRMTRITRVTRMTRMTGVTTITRTTKMTNVTGLTEANILFSPGYSCHLMLYNTVMTLFSFFFCSTLKPFKKKNVAINFLLSCCTEMQQSKTATNCGVTQRCRSSWLYFLLCCNQLCDLLWENIHLL